jgi:hypothetical protein
MTTRILAAAALTIALAAPVSAQVRGNRGGVVVVQPQVNVIPVPVAVPVNPWGVNPWAANPWAVNPWVRPTPPIAVQQPGLFVFRNPNLYVNPVAGTVVRPQTGVAQLRDGSTFFRVPGSTDYYNPVAGTYYNPASGVVLRPGLWW